MSYIWFVLAHNDQVQMALKLKITSSFISSSSSLPPLTQPTFILLISLISFSSSSAHLSLILFVFFSFSSASAHFISILIGFIFISSSSANLILILIGFIIVYSSSSHLILILIGFIYNSSSYRLILFLSLLASTLTHPHRLISS